MFTFQVTGELVSVTKMQQFVKNSVYVGTGCSTLVRVIGVVFRWVPLSVLSRDVRCGLFFGPKKMHPSVTTQILLPDMFVRCDTIRH